MEGTGEVAYPRVPLVIPLSLPTLEVSDMVDNKFR